MTHLEAASRTEWPEWARPQLRAAVTLAASSDGGRALVRELYDGWFAPTVQTVAGDPQPLVGAYRQAHSASATNVIDGVPVLDRHDRVGSDGWWRTWNTSWRPRQDGTRLLLSPRPDAVVTLVALLTRELRDVPYLLACATEPSRLARTASAVLYLPRLTTLTPALVDSVAALLRPDSPPLCLPLAPGLAFAQYPTNGMTFGEHRCHLVALALARPGDALREIAEVFSRHGIDPAAPYRSRSPR